MHACLAAPRSCRGACLGHFSPSELRWSFWQMRNFFENGQGGEVNFTTPSLKEQVTGCDSAQTEVAGNEKYDDDETDQPDDLIHGFSP